MHDERVYGSQHGRQGRVTRVSVLDALRTLYGKSIGGVMTGLLTVAQLCWDVRGPWAGGRGDGGISNRA